MITISWPGRRCIKHKKYRNAQWHDTFHPICHKPKGASRLLSSHASLGEIERGAGSGYCLLVNPRKYKSQYMFFRMAAAERRANKITHHSG